ncbi:uncharacterized protein TrAtP1_004246 [Trichoderma atroviride]|uniref:uncharacterized protein n=1 Tax=Hypocrea atroviridis TaxID=63577 RepID=UPI00332C8C43|nr:hypothetical protein TrAtP1_004246 [Trichoderma atroviride]
MRRGLPFFFSPNSILFTSPALLADGSSLFCDLNLVAAVGRRISFAHITYPSIPCRLSDRFWPPDDDPPPAPSPAPSSLCQLAHFQYRH